MPLDIQAGQDVFTRVCNLYSTRDIQAPTMVQAGVSLLPHRWEFEETCSNGALSIPSVSRADKSHRKG